MKLFKTVQDHAVGFQSVNQAIDNHDALKTLFDVKHAIGVNGNSPYLQPTRSVGRHDDMVIARSVADFKVDTTLVTPALVPYVSGPLFSPLLYQRLAVGSWRIFIGTAQLLGAVALMKSSASVDYKANCFVNVDPVQGPSIYVTTWNVPTPITADLPFSLQVWTQVS